MIKAKELCLVMKKMGIGFFTGVPDSTFKGWISFLSQTHGKFFTNIIAPSECEAVAIASGYHLATGKIAVVYMQNSGLGKANNPLTSLCDSEVYSIPLMLMIGLRGEAGQADEPQHKKMGQITLPLLDVLKIPYQFLPDEKNKIKKAISKALVYMNKKSAPFAFIVRRGVIGDFETDSCRKSPLMTREKAIKIVADNLKKSEVIVSTTGKTSRELFECRIKNHERPKDFYTVGSMGCASSIAFSLAFYRPNRKIVVFDGDGALIMQMGALSSIGHYKLKNFFHVVFDNGSYESTGGQPTVSSSLDFKKIAIGCGYRHAFLTSSETGLKKAVKKFIGLEGPTLLVVKVCSGSRKDLCRPTTTPPENKELFIKWLKNR